LGLCACTASNPEAPAEPDADGDGWRVSNGDCDDTRPDVYPGAPETCDDGIDQNCSPHGCLLPLVGAVDQLASRTFSMPGFGDIEAGWLGCWTPDAFFTAWEYKITKWTLRTGAYTVTPTPLAKSPISGGMYVGCLGNDIVLLQGFDADKQLRSYVVQAGLPMSQWSEAMSFELTASDGEVGEPLSGQETLIVSPWTGQATLCGPEQCLPTEVALPGYPVWRTVGFIRLERRLVLVVEGYAEGVYIWDVEAGETLSFLPDPADPIYIADSSIAVGSFADVEPRLVLGTERGALIVAPETGDAIVLAAPFSRGGSPNMAVFDADLDGFDDLFLGGIDERGGILVGYSGADLDVDVGPEAITWRFDLPGATRLSIGAADLVGDGDADLAIADQAGERMFGLLARRD
jgi:hypothetical protein